MENQKLFLQVKELRKRKGLSQEILAKKSGLSLRTVQRVENGETEPTGETLKRISAVLDVALNKLIDWNNNKEVPKKTVKINKEYLHIFDDKLIISTDSECTNLVDDYKKSVSNVFKTMMVFLVFIPIFTTVGIVFYNLEKIGLASYAGAIIIFFLVQAFYIMLFTSGAPMIKRNTIIKMGFKKKLIFNTIQIEYKDIKRIKTRSFVVDNNQINNVLNILKNEGLIKNNIDYTYGKNKAYAFIITSVLFFALLQILSAYSFGFLPKTERIFAGYAVFFLVLSFLFISRMIYQSISYSSKKREL